MSDSAPEHADRGAKKKLALASGPIFLENPDGSYLEGVPPGYKEKTPPMSPRGRLMQEGLGEEAAWEFANQAMLEEFDFIYSRHKQLFGCLLFLQLTVESAYNVVFVISAPEAISQVYELYNGSVERSTLQVTFWSLFAMNLTYCLVYYSVGGLALWADRPRYYKMFATCGLVGIATQMLLAYINKFNLLIFFLRLIAYVYAKFLRNLAQTLSLLPPLPQGRQIAGSPPESPRPPGPDLA